MRPKEYGQLLPSLNFSAPLDKALHVDCTIHMDIANLKVRRQTVKRLKLLAALQEDTMMNVLDRLVEQELARMEAERKKGRSDADHTGL